MGHIPYYREADTVEVYLITCKITGKFYIGSTSVNKEFRWSNPSSRWSHLNTAKSGDTRPLYKDIRSYGEDNFELSTLEIVQNKDDLLNREDFWIKKYFQEYGKDKMYNAYAGAKISGDGHQLCTPEAIAKSLETKVARYGTEFYVDQDGIAKRWSTCQSNHSGLCSELAFKNRSSEFEYHGKLYYGVTNLYNQLISEGYDLSWNMVRRLALNNYMSKANRVKYPELINAIKVLRYTKRGAEIRKVGDE